MIAVPTGVKVSLQGSTFSVEGPKGKLSSSVSPLIELVMNDKQIECKFTGKDDQKGLHGITRTLITNMIQGSVEGFKKVLEINGVGYRANLKGQVLELLLIKSLLV